MALDLRNPFKKAPEPKPDTQPPPSNDPHHFTRQELEAARPIIDFSELWTDQVEGGFLAKIIPYINTVLLFVILVLLVLK